MLPNRDLLSFSKAAVPERTEIGQKRISECQWDTYAPTRYWSHTEVALFGAQHPLETVDLPVISEEYILRHCFENNYLMIPFEVASVYFFTSTLIIIAPGPDNIYVLTQSALYGRSAGLIATTGVCTGLLVHTSAISFGVAAIFQTSALAFNILKILGVLYLPFLAWQVFRSDEASQINSRSLAVRKVKLYSRGLLMNVTNPKVAIFFLSFLPRYGLKYPQPPMSR